MKLADLLKERGKLDELRARADAGDLSAATGLADLLKERGDRDELRAQADAGDGYAAMKLADLLARSGATGTSCAPGLMPATSTLPCF